MKTKPITIILVVVSAFFSACNRSNDSAEIQRLREENERLKAAKATPTPQTPTPAVESPDYQNFLRVARRLMTAIEAGISFQDFHQRVTDVLASAKEASRSAPTPAKQKAIATFATAITDAHDIWRFKVNNDKNTLKYSIDGGVPNRLADFAGSPCSDRWDFKASELIKAYKLDVYEPGYLESYNVRGANATVAIDFSLKKIFKFCGETFAILESSK
jgi:hypothetical protein